MNVRKTIIVLAMASICMGTAAQTRDYRNPGFKGSVAVTDQLGVFVGADVSLGKMLNRKNYIGGGVSGYLFPKDGEIPVYGNIFGEYRHYFKDAGKSMFAGSKAGLAHAFNYDNNDSITFQNGILLEPNFGWSWGLKSGHGLELGLGATLIAPFGDTRTARKVIGLPKLAFGFSF